MKPINIYGEKQRFKAHLELTCNSNILFSGIFGIGKTYFINDFFKENAEYEAIMLSPVNYSVSRNEDIFELIKYDILFELLGNGNLEIDDTKFSELLTASCFAYENATQIISHLIEFVPKVGKNIKDVISAFEKIKTLYDKYKESANCTEKKQINIFIQNIINQKGHALEEDSITQLITALIDRLKTDTKQTVLIIDDLDRIDPEHIFRLFNIFACHIDTKKFMFDKIIFVCDVENIRNIFHSKYGMNVDFTGYIDKFFSHEIFHFDNTPKILNRLFDVFKDCIGTYKYDDFYSFEQDAAFRYIMSSLLASNALNLRAIIRSETKALKMKNYSIYTGIKSYELKIVMIYEYLLALYETHESLDTALTKCERKCQPLEIQENEACFGSILLLLGIEKHQMRDEKYTLFFHEELLTIEYTLKASNIESIIFTKDEYNQKPRLHKYPFFTLLRRGFNQINTYKTYRIRP